MNTKRTKVDPIAFIKEYAELHKDYVVIIGTDSQFYSGQVNYVTAIVLTNEDKNGSRVIYSKICEKNIKKLSIYERLSNEAKKSIELALYLQSNGIIVKKIEIDCQSILQTKSTNAYNSHSGWIESLGFEVAGKPSPLFATVAADVFTRHKK